MTNPSICIPRTTLDVDEQLVRRIFNKYKLGPIKRIDIVHNTQYGNKRIFIHFKYWFDNQKNLDIKEKLLNGESINIIYAKPWFWKCSVSKIPKP